MGNHHSFQNRDNNPKKLNSVIALYILSLKPNDLKNLLNLEYCNQLISVLSILFIQEFSKQDIEEVVGNINLQTQNNKYDVRDVAKHYVKIAHLFATNIISIFNINTLIQGLSPTTKEAEQTNTMYLEGGRGNGSRKEKGEYEYVAGIPEFIDLYYDDNYDISSGKFNGMTKDNLLNYKKDLYDFYSHLSEKNKNREGLPETINRFLDITISDIDLQDREELKPDDGLFICYAKTLKGMIFNSNQTINALIENINVLFDVDKSDADKSDADNNEICISDNLDTDRLQELIDISRSIISEFYITYESDMSTISKIYESIVNTQILKTTMNQLRALDEEQIKMTYI